MDENNKLAIKYVKNYVLKHYVEILQLHKQG